MLAHAAKDWRAGQAYLAAQRPEKWGKKLTVDDGPKRLEIAGEDRKRAEELLDRLGYKRVVDVTPVALPGVPVDPAE